mgnify:CR=1 FL=1
MAKPLVTASLVAPAFLGLNTQESSVANDPKFALTANNCVIDQFGRLGARKGWLYRTSSGGSNVNLLGMHPFLDIAGANTLVSWSATKFYTGLATLTERTPTTGDTINAGNWSSATLNDRAYFFQRNFEPLYLSNETGSLVFESLDEHDDYTGTAPEADIVLSAFGRLWAADTVTNKTTVFFSNLLNGAQWGTGSAGSINISGVLPKGQDIITGLGEMNGFLIVFCKNHIVIYKDGDAFGSSFDPTSLQLVEVISGVGCLARDSIQNTGTDIIFLSGTGLRSLGRTVQEKSQPMNDISKNVRDLFMDDVNREANPHLIKSCYFPEEAFYIISLPEAEEVFVFDTRQQLEDASLRVTTWNNLTHTDYIYDPTVPNVNKLLKRAAVTAIGSTGQSFSLKIGFDYTTSYFSIPFSLKETTVSEYGIAEYNNAAAEYNLGVSLDRIDQSVSGSGSIVQIGIETTIDGAQLSVQKLDVYAKQGRII